MTDGEPISQGELPSDLEQVPSDERLPVALGWTPLAASVALFGFAILLLDINRVNNRTSVTARSSPEPWFEGIYGIIAAAVLLGVVLLLYEVLRRLSRTVLVARKELIGIYRKRKLVQTISASQIVHYKLSWWNNVQFIFFPAVLTFAMFAVLATESAQDTFTLLSMLALAFSALAITASLVRTRLMCVHLLIPTARRGRREILIPRSEVSRLSLNV
jgi:uncharacterized membrane protein